jgi:tetratricopeptide (TPR) repeat protein
MEHPPSPLRPVGPETAPRGAGQTKQRRSEAERRWCSSRWFGAELRCLLLLLTILPASAPAQQDPATVAPAATAAAHRAVFLEGLSELTAAVAGTYGDEGALVVPALDKMAGGLAQWDRAIQGFESRLASELPGAQPRVAFQLRETLARIYVERGRLADALRELDAASRLDPRRADVHVLRGLVLDASARSTDAGEAFRSAWALDASDPIKAYHVFQHAATTGNTKDMQGARRTLAAAYLRLLQDAARAKASPFVGIEPLQTSAADTPILSPAAYRPGYARLAHGEYAEAIAEFRTAAAIDPLVTDPTLRSVSMTRATAALRQGRLADARSLIEGSTAQQDSPEAHRVLGLTYWADSQDGKSIEQLEIAIRGNPRDERSRLALAGVLTSAGRDSEAERTLRDTIHDLPDSALARWSLGSGYERLNRFADARREFELALAGAVAGRSQLHASIGRLAAAAADFPGAIEAFARSVSASPNDPSMHTYLAGALLQQDRADEAFVELVAALLIDPRDAGAHTGIGQIHLNAGRSDEAVPALRRAVELSPGYTEARYALATALMRSGHTQEAARELERVEQAQRQMLADRRRHLSLDVLKEEAALRAAEGSDDRAAALWQQAIDREPDRPSNHLGLAAALAGAGRIDAAIAHYEKAATLGADPVVYRRLAELYAKVGRILDAARAGAMYERALQGDRTSQGPAR